MSKTHLLRLGHLFAALGLFAGCGRSAVDLPTADTGTLTVAWQIAGSREASACDDAGASEVEIAVYDDMGSIAADAFADCADFGITLQLREGVYEGEVTLLDDKQTPVSETLPLKNLRIEADTELRSEVAF
jgi:hypothetical protein